jgi:RND family efflux transporter MFP subunit
MEGCVAFSLHRIEGYLVSVFLLSLFGCATKNIEPVSAPPPEVTVAQPVKRQVTEFYEYVGRTKAPQFVEIRSRVTGYLTKIHFSDGQEVKAGDPLFEIDNRPYQYALETARARLQQAEAQLKLSNQFLERNRSLVNTNAVAQQELDDAVQKQASALAELNASKASISQAELDLEFCSITAPISGRLSQTSLTVGNLISSTQSSTPPLTTIASVDPIHVLFDVDEATVLRFREMRRQLGDDVQFTQVRELNQKILISLSNETDFPHEGVLDFVDNEVRTTTGTLLVRAELNNANRFFAPGMFVRVRIPIGNPIDSLLVPERAILNDQSIKYVLVADENDVAQRHDVELGPTDNGMRVIRRGIDPSDRVIINGIQRARPGAKVKAGIVKPATEQN